MIKNYQYPPKDYFYNGGFADLTKCKECEMIGLYYDLHPANPCHYCGGERQEGFIGRWIKTSPWWKFWKNEGHWELKVK